MLVLTRKEDEGIVIDGRITVTVVEIRGGKVKLGVTAPKEVSVHRQEVQALVDSHKERGENDG